MPGVEVNLVHVDKGNARIFTFEGHEDARLVDAEIRALRNLLRPLMSNRVEGGVVRFEVEARKVVVYKDPIVDSWEKIGSEFEPRIRAVLRRSMLSLGYADVRVE